MEGLAEQIVPKKIGSGEWFARIGALACCGLALFAFVWIGIYVLVLEFFVAYGAYLVFRYTNYEYEYSYVSGQFTVTKIMGESKRKTILEVDLDKAEKIVREDSEEISYALQGGTPVLDVSGDFDTEEVSYIMMASVDGENRLIRFSPDEKLLKCMKQDYPRKVSDSAS